MRFSPLLEVDPFVGSTRYTAEVGRVVELTACCACAWGVVGLRQGARGKLTAGYRDTPSDQKLHE